MMKQATINFVLLFAVLLLTGCSSNREELSLTFVMDTPITTDKYPSYFKDAVLPFNNSECETDFLLKPINFVRADIKRTEVESNAWHFENIGDNTVEFSTGWLTQYFNDSLTNPYLKSPQRQKKMKLDSYLKNKENIVIIYAEESELDEYNGVPILHTSSEIRNQIQKTACGNVEKKVVVLVNPMELREINPDSIKGNQPVPQNNPCEEKTVAEAFVVREKIQEIIDVNRSFEERLKSANELWAEFFDPNAYVASYKSKSDNNPDVYNPGEGLQYFTNKLAVLESIHTVAIFRTETSKKSGKISGIHIVECHDANEVL